MSKMQIIDCAQGSEDWYRARAGIPTASEFATILAKGRGSSESKGRRTYMLKLAGERLTGEPMESFSNHHLERGKVMEEEARDFYAFTMDADPVQVGFIRNETAGASPDSLIGDEGLLEIKTALPHILADTILRDEFPAEHVAQTQGQLWVTGREWVDLLVYWPGMPRFIKRARRDEAYISTIASEVERFNSELEQVVEKLRAYGSGALAASV